MPRAKKPTQPKVWMIRFGSGEDIVCKVEKENKNTFIAVHPMTTITEIDIESKSQQLIMFPWLARGVIKEDRVLVLKADVFCTVTLEKQVEDYYLQASESAYAIKPKLLSEVQGRLTEINKESKPQANQNVVKLDFTRPRSNT